MNEDDLEKKLAPLSEALKEADPTPAWKTEILSRALNEAQAAKIKRGMLPPRWLMVTWGAAWAASFVLNLAAPESTMFPPSTQPSATAAGPMPYEALLAYNRQLTLNLNLPE